MPDKDNATLQRLADHLGKQHSHCWHRHHGPIWMVLRNGHTVQACCECGNTRTVHVDHA